MEREEKNHESYGMLQISKYSCNHDQFFGSDLVHGNGISLTISRANVENNLSKNWFHSGEDLIEIKMTSNQFVDAITSGMNTSGVPCTITRFNRKMVPQIDHIEDKKDMFNEDMNSTQEAYYTRIDEILLMLEGNIGQKKKKEIIHEIKVLKSHIKGNTKFVMKSFNEAMEKTVTEAKHSISNYIDHKVHTLGIEGMQEQLKLQISMKNENQ